MKKSNIYIHDSILKKIKQSFKKTKQFQNAYYCRNNCNFISINSLLIDLTLMLSYAELLVDENITEGRILVPIGSIYKYHKYIASLL